VCHNSLKTYTKNLGVLFILNIYQKRSMNDRDVFFFATAETQAIPFIFNRAQKFETH
jgi:hypothetical protein